MLLYTIGIDLIQQIAKRVPTCDLFALWKLPGVPELIESRRRIINQLLDPAELDKK